MVARLKKHPGADLPQDPFQAWQLQVREEGAVVRLHAETDVHLECRLDAGAVLLKGVLCRNFAWSWGPWEVFSESGRGC